MKEYNQHEQFELEVLNLLSKNQLLNNLIFGGGTALRLCYGLDRYSVDLDFFAKENFKKEQFLKIKEVLGEKYEISDFQEKYYSYLIELKSAKYPKKLKIEIRKEKKQKYETETSIAFSPLSFIQVRLTTMSLNQMWINKIKAFLDRSAIRDAYDLEFIYKKGFADIKILSEKEKKNINEKLKSFKRNDFKVTLGSLLNKQERDYYAENGFKVLLMSLK